MMSPLNDPEGRSTVINISRLPLNDLEINLLSKGLSFCPTLHHINKAEIIDHTLYHQLYHCLNNIHKGVKREKGTKRQTDRQTERERQRDTYMYVVIPIEDLISISSYLANTSAKML